jgi:hypothetical protein
MKRKQRQIFKKYVYFFDPWHLHLQDQPEMGFCGVCSRVLDPTYLKETYLHNTSLLASIISSVIGTRSFCVVVSYRTLPTLLPRVSDPNPHLFCFLGSYHRVCLRNYKNIAASGSTHGLIVFLHVPTTLWPLLLFDFLWTRSYPQLEPESGSSGSGIAPIYFWD